jgi:Winged helix DNA-binding domain
VALTPAELNRATLARQLLLRREPIPPPDAVRHLLALQAQHPASPYLALWNRLAGFDAAVVDAALADGTLLKATMLRTTLHVVHAQDHAVLHTALQPTLHGPRSRDERFVASGLSPGDADALLPALLEHLASPRSNAEVEEWLTSRVPGSAAGAWWALRATAPMVHAPTGGPWSFGPRPRYLAAPARPGGGDGAAPEACLRAVVARYLAAYGPASVADAAGFARLPSARVRAAVEDLLRDGEVVTVDGAGSDALVDLPGAPLPAGDTPAPPRLLGMWDSVLLAYADRSRVIPPAYRPLVIRVNGDVLPTLLVDGRVAGVWRPVGDGIEATAFHRLPDDAWAGLAAEARGLRLLLADREPGVYRRYGRWWAGLATADVRVLAG